MDHVEETNRHPGARRRNALECAFVSATYGRAEDDAVAFGKDIFECQCNIRECGTKSGQALLLAVEGERWRRWGNVAPVVRGHEGREVPAMPDVLNVATQEQLVRFGRHEPLPCAAKMPS